MSRSELVRAAGPQALVERLAEPAARLPRQDQGHGHDHGNEDRTWAAWQQRFPDAPYLPDQSAPEALRGHRVDDEPYSLLTDPVTPRQLLDPSEFYRYDTLDLT